MHFRNATADDISRCIELLKDDNGFQAEPELWDALPSLWADQLAQQTLAGFQVFEKTQRHGPSVICGFRMSAFVKSAFSFSYAAHPYPQVAADIWRRVRDNQSPLLSRDEIAWANARGELRLAVLHTCVTDRQPSHPDTMQFIALLAQAWQQAHFGFRLRSLPIFELYGAVASQLAKSAGYSEYAFADADIDNPGKSHVFRWSLDDPCTAVSLVAHAFAHCLRPRFHFTPAQQRLLLSALDGRSDKEIAADFGIRYDTVRQSWDAIFQRIEAVDDSLLPNPAKRGGERRRSTIEYVRQHLEEARPYDKRAADEGMLQTPYLQMLSALPD